MAHPADLADLADLNRLTAELAGLSHGFGAAQRSLAEPAEGSDATGAITVLLDERGRVAAVRPSSRWRQLIAGDQVGEAVVEAAQAALVARLDRWSEILDAQPTIGADDQSVTVESHLQSATDLTAARTDAPFVDVLGLVGEVTSALGQAMEAADRSLRPPESGPGGDVSVLDPATTIGSRPVVVHLDPGAAVERVDIEMRWLAGADRGRLAGGLTDAFARAYEAADRSAEREAGTSGDAAAADNLTPMSAELTALVRDPAGVLAAFAAHL